MRHLDVFVPSFSDELTKISKVLSESDRDHMSKKTFALPKSEEYPIPDAQHARSALGFAAMHHKGTAEEAKVRAAVHKKFPGLEKQATGYSFGHHWDFNKINKDPRVNAAFKKDPDRHYEDVFNQVGIELFGSRPREMAKHAGALDRRGSALAFLKDAEPENTLTDREASAPGWLETYRSALGA